MALMRLFPKRFRKKNTHQTTYAARASEDRLCIAQHDMALKEQGIRGLGSFLEKSQNLTILWSGRYFSRLSLGLDTGMGQRYVVSPITFVSER